MPAPAANLSNPAVDSYNVRVGTQTFAGLYQFTTNTLLVETAEAISGLGSDTIKMFLASDFPRQYRITLPSNVTNLMTLARDEPSCRRVLDMPFRHVIAWIYPFSNFWPFDGYSASERANEYNEVYDLTHYLLTNYNNSGKSFYLGHWEGDWYLLPDYNTATNPSPVAIQGMIDWLNNRQKAIDDAKHDTGFTNVNVFCYAEVNRVRDAMVGGTNMNQRAINKVVPYITNLDYVSWSSYDGMNLSSSDLYATLDYMESNLPINKAAVLTGKRIWVGEYGWGSLSTAAQEPLTRAYIQRLLPWGPRFILFWEIYNNETNNNFCLIDSNNTKVASWYLHQRFINQARLLTAQFQESNGRLPNSAEFATLVTPMLNQPLPAPVALAVSNRNASAVSGTAATVTGTIAQGIYGDEQATVRVYWGRQDGGTVRGNWEQSLLVGLNTNFNPVVFTAQLTNLTPQTNYLFRFYATNASGEAWAPASTTFGTAVLDPQSFGSRMKISFSGYTRPEALANFPVLVMFSTNCPGFSYRQFGSPRGGDLRFTDATGTHVIYHEIDEWNTNGASSVWVQMPMLSSTNDFIWAYWGNPSATTLPAYSTNGSVWSPDFELVWHLKESGFPYVDSTLKHPGTSGNSPSSSLGQVGHGCLFDGTADFLNAGNINLGDHFTLSAWVKVDPSINDIQTVWANKAGGSASAGFALFANSWKTHDQKLILETGNGAAGSAAGTDTNIVSLGAWHHIAASVDRSAGSTRLFVDGMDRTISAATRTDFANQGNVALGYFTNNFYYFKGTLDEARIETQTRSSNWLWASWMTVASNTAFSSCAAVTRQTPAISFVTSDSNLVLSWPASSVGFALYTATNLAPPIAWILDTNQQYLLNGQWQVTLPIDRATARFFRLQSQ